MLSETVINWFLPAHVRHNKAHADFHQMYSLVSASIVGSMAMATIPILLHYFESGSYLWTYYLNVATTFLTLLSLRYTGHWRLPNYFSAAIAYFIVFTWIDNSGLIYSVNMGMLYLYLICSLLVDHKFGWLAIFTNLLLIAYIYYLTIHAQNTLEMSAMLGNPVHALLMHVVITIFMGSFLAYGLRKQEMNRIRIKALQEKQINVLDEVVRERTQQLGRLRQTMATDFHDQTGNMLAAINRQAAMLELKLRDDAALMVFVRSIIDNSNGLYASSKDFLWTLHHDSDNPLTLFQYLTGYGQNFYNQFDVSFSVENKWGCEESGQLDPFAALNLIYIFKEAMTNVIKHAGADEVLMSLLSEPHKVYFTLWDNGQWKHPAEGVAHYGINNMKRRAEQSGFEYELVYNEAGTRISVGIPTRPGFIKKEAQ